MEFELPLDDLPSPPFNLLPVDGEAIYHGVIFERPEAESFYKTLLTEIPWRHDEAIMFGKHIVTDRKVAWYGDENYSYTYSGHNHVALKWTDTLLAIKTVVEKISDYTYNSCLLNLYEDGSQGMGWHHDDEKGLGKNANIASVSFGAERRFDFRHKQSREKVSVILEHGGLLIMRGTTQSNWQHQIPKTKKVTSPRINLTFRRMLHDS